MKKKAEKKKPELLVLIDPRNLRREIDSYGYSFSMGKYLLFIAAVIMGAVICGLLFSLRWYYIVVVAVTGILCLPSFILTGYKNMYEHKQFLDISDYMEQILYSFKNSQKILTSLKDTQTLYEPGSRMYDTIQKAVDHITAGSYKKDLYREAFAVIEQEYPCKRLYAIHGYLESVEENGGENDNSIDLLLQDKAVWADNIILLQQDKKAARTKVIFSILVTVFLAMIFQNVYRSMPEQYSIIYHPVVQVAATLYMMINILIFKKANRELSKSWIDRENIKDDRKVQRYYKLVTEYDEKAEQKKSIILSVPFFAAAVPLAVFFNVYVALGAAVVGLLMLNQHRMGYRTAYDVIVQEINQTFPGWLMEMALLLQANNVQVSIKKTIDHAPVVLQPELQKLMDGLRESPDAVEPYLEFLGMFKLSSVQSAMKMLYAISESGTGDAQTQIAVLVQRNSKMMDQAEKLLNEKSLTGLNGIFYLPQVTVSFQTMADMVVFMMMFLGQMKL